MIFQNNVIRAAVCSLLMSLSACGGGDTEESVEGFYKGYLNDPDTNATALVDSNNNVWLSYGYNNDPSGLSYHWNYVAKATVSNGKFQATGFDTGVQRTTTYTHGLVKDDSRDVNIPLIISPRTYHGYSQIQTPYHSAYQHTQATIDGSNNIRGSDDFGCTFSGKLTLTGKAYHYVSISFGEGNCGIRTSKTFDGVVYSLNSNSLKVIIRNGDNVMIALLSKNA